LVYTAAGEDCETNMGKFDNDGWNFDKGVTE